MPDPVDPFLFYDKDGAPLSPRRFGELRNDADYFRVGSTDVGPYWVSTVWLGVDHSFGYASRPILFETMVFARSERADTTAHGLHDMDCVRYATEPEARQGHEDMVTLIRATLADEPELLAEPENTRDRCPRCGMPDIARPVRLTDAATDMLGPAESGARGCGPLLLTCPNCAYRWHVDATSGP